MTEEPQTEGHETKNGAMLRKNYKILKLPIKSSHCETTKGFLPILVSHFATSAGFSTTSEAYCTPFDAP